jgi:hypothetical protein
MVPKSHVHQMIPGQSQMALMNVCVIVYISPSPAHLVPGIVIVAADDPGDYSVTIRDNVSCFHLPLILSLVFIPP